MSAISREFEHIGRDVDGVRYEIASELRSRLNRLNFDSLADKTFLALHVNSASLQIVYRCECARCDTHVECEDWGCVWTPDGLSSLHSRAIEWAIGRFVPYFVVRVGIDLSQFRTTAIDTLRLHCHSTQLIQCQSKASQTAVVCLVLKNRIRRYTTRPLKYLPLERVKNGPMDVRWRKCGMSVCGVLPMWSYL